MNTLFRDAMRLAGLAALAVSLAPAGEPASTVQVDKGVATFDDGTNVSVFSVHGTSKDLQARVKVRDAGDQMMLEQVEAWVPVKSIATGMGVRDEHMRKYVFVTQDGKMPDLKFTASEVTCPAARGGEVECPVAGQLAIRGVAKPFTMVLKVRSEGGGAAFRAAGAGTVKLSDYGIERPSQFGVKTDNLVKLRVDFSGKSTAAMAANRGGSR